ncbi:MAG TPA: MerR family transcriptional regulator, partial [Pseudoneobacillus sp.]|nr:MerR family transcriptional regulator [Pseudoneobacillus sp.]
MLLTIQQFSEKTGMSPSALRFYDKKKLLIPECRLENGYRAYSEEQISVAMIIHSLRNADIKIEEIKDFLNASEQEKSKLISKWREEVHIKSLALKIAQQYLGGLNSKENHIQLIRWEETVTFIWFKHTVERKDRPFQEAMIQDYRKLNEWGYKVAPGYFV